MAAERRSSSILVIDDDPDVRWAVKGVLEDEGLAVDVAADGVAAVAHATQRPPRLVLLDIRLPGGSGNEVAQQLRVILGADLPILVITGDGSAPRKATDVGAYAYLQKPFELTHLVQLVHRGLSIL